MRLLRSLPPKSASGRTIRFAMAAALTFAFVGTAPAQTAQTVAGLVAEGYQVISFSPIQGGFAALLVNYREATPRLVLCNLNLNPDTRQMVTSGCFEVR